MRTLLIVLMLATAADAQIFRRRMQKQVVVKQVLVQSAVQTLFLVAPPSYYGVPAYTPPQAAAARTEPEERLRPDTRVLQTLQKVVETLVSLEERISSLESQPGQPPPPEPPPLIRIPLVVQENCGKCHSGPEAKGDFNLNALGDPKKLLMSQAMVLNSKMPLDADGEVVELKPYIRAEIFAALKKMESQQ